MLKKRIIPVQLLLEERLIKTVQFANYRPVGDPIASSKVYNSQYADELIFLNIQRSSRNSDSLLRLIEQVSEVSFMPLTFGGGIRKLADAASLLKNGADKVVLNSAPFENDRLISEIAGRFGSQAVVISMDVRWDSAVGQYVLYSDCGKKRELISLEAHIRRSIENGAGEVLINSIDRDGTMMGYDLPLMQWAVKYSTVPVIACGGAGNFEHLRAAFIDAGVHAVACGSLFNFGDNNPIRAKACLSNYGLEFKKV